MRVLGIDLGTRRIGVAVSDASGTLARPVRAVAGSPSIEESARRVVAEIERFSSEDEGLAEIVVGWPRRLDGSPNDETARVEAVVARVRQQTTLPIVLQDERLSSREAESRLALREKDWRKRKARLDAAAAAVILQDYLDQRR